LQINCKGLVCEPVGNSYTPFRCFRTKRERRARLDAERIGNCRLIEGDAYDIVELARDPADMVIMANTFHGVPDKAKLGRAIASAL
jgi:hypothetical protein